MNFNKHFTINILLSLFLSLITVPSQCQVIGIDYGSNLIKVTAVVPGKHVVPARPIDIVMDETASRSHPSLVVLDADIRHYGSSASNLVCPTLFRLFDEFVSLQNVFISPDLCVIYLFHHSPSFIHIIDHLPS